MSRSSRSRTVLVRIVGGATAAVPLVLFALAVQHGRAFGWELAIEDAVAPLRLPELLTPAAAVTQLGAGPVLYPLLAVVCWSTATRAARRRPTTWLPLLLLAAGQVLESVLLAPTLRVGPAVADLPLSAVGSGHVAGAVLGWGLIARQLRSTRFADEARVAAVTVPPLVAVTRVVLGKHWAADVLVGLAAGVGLLVLALLVLRWTDASTDGSLRPSLLPSAQRAGAASPRDPTWWRTSPWAWSVPAVVALGALLAALDPPREKWFGDLLVYAGSGDTVGLGQNVYAYRTMFGLPFTYPPFAAVLAEPLGRVPWPLLQAGWFLATLVAAVAVASVVLRPVVLRIGLPLTVAALLLSAPMRSHLHFGQVGVFLVLLVAVDLLGRTRRPGMGLGVAIAVKLTPAVFLPWLVVMRDRVRLRATLLTAGACTAAGLVLLWPSAQPYLFGALWDSSRFGANDLPGNQSVRGMLLRAGLDGRAAALTWLILAAGLTVAALRSARRLERGGNRLGAVSVLVCLSVAVSPITWVHHLVWLTFPIAALVAAGRVRLAAAWWVALVLSLPTYGTRLDQWLPVLHPLWLLVVDLQGLTAVAVIVLLPRLLQHVGSEPESRGVSATA